ncbi:MAG: hypothetical protein DME41_09480 [Verrucomicrobia bacterium]|nr:MAG: hypothetical protein DME41_09480 [Verrucomicrobiota bacterium]
MAAFLVAIGHFNAMAQQRNPPQPAADTSGLDFHQFGLLAAQDGGRRKPIDTFSRETLIRITGRSRYVGKAGRKWQANDFVLSGALETHDWRTEPMVLVSLGQLKEKLGLDKTERRFSFEQLVASTELQRLLALLANIMNGSALLIVPASKSETDPWVVPPEFSRYYSETQFAPIQIELQTTATSYAQADGFNFSRAASRLRESLRALSPSIYPQERQLRLEYFYNHFEAFYRAIWFYGLAFVILLVAHARGGGRLLRSVGVSVASLAIAFHVSGIVMRCLIAGRPPVTNMYESVIWVSFAASAFAMIFYARYRTVIYLVAALPATFLALLLVHQMPIAMPASIDPLVPVLRDNFWLTVHVLTITLSYAAFLLAWAFGNVMFVLYTLQPVKTRDNAALHFWLYRIMQLGVLLLAAGTILGGVWANYSWGRFWGWDPKETWALIALLCYLTALHGRLAGWWAEFGLVVASVVCFLAVLMAWYGVNFVLGKGLHSYGFGIGGETYVAIGVVLDLLFVAFAIWRYRSSKRTPSSAPAEAVAV